MNAPVLVSTDYLVKPTNTALHQAYTFYAYVSDSGGSSSYFGPYILNVGCFSGSVSFADSVTPAFVLTVNKLVGDSLTSAYTMNSPTSNRAYCTVVSHAIVNPDATGTTWTGAAKLTGSGSQPFSTFDLVSTSVVETVSFKVKTTLTNSLTHLSAQAQIVISCGSNYPITETSALTSPQLLTHGTTDGFHLPSYAVTTHNTACPVNNR